MIRYDRAPSPQFEALLAPGGFLAPLLEPRLVAGLPLDVHLREKDHVQVYCGLTRLIDGWLSKGGVRVAANSAYTQQQCADELFRSWSVDDAGFNDAVTKYLDAVVVNPSHVRSEGAVQAAWAAVRSPWIPFDREAVIGYASSARQAAGRAFPAVDAARDEVEALPKPRPWALTPKNKVGAELDQLAVDPDGRLVLLELKDAGASSGSVFYSPLQLLQYVHEWAAAYDAVRDQLDALIEARVRLKMTPADIPRLRAGLRPVVGFGEDTRSTEVRARFDTVRAIVNRHLPPTASPMEAWVIENGKPVRLG